MSINTFCRGTYDRRWRAPLISYQHNDIVVSMIPPSDENLPPGVHVATWAEVVDRFGTTPHRMRLLDGLKSAALALRSAGCTTLYLDGSFVTSKDVPADYDGCWSPQGVQLAKLDPILKTFDRGRMAQKAKFGGELFPSTARADAKDSTFLEFFQKDREGNAKGILAIDLGSLGS